MCWASNDGPWFALIVKSRVYSRDDSEDNFFDKIPLGWSIEESTRKETDNSSIFWALILRRNTGVHVEFY